MLQHARRGGDINARVGPWAPTATVEVVARGAAATLLSAILRAAVTTVWNWTRGHVGLGDTRASSLTPLAIACEVVVAFEAIGLI